MISRPGANNARIEDAMTTHGRTKHVIANVSVARGITTDAAGSVYVTGNADSQWIVQKLVLP